jgi:hypothetical protein
LDILSRQEPLWRLQARDLWLSPADRDYFPIFRLRRRKRYKASIAPAAIQRTADKVVLSIPDPPEKEYTAISLKIPLFLTKRSSPSWPGCRRRDSSRLPARVRLSSRSTRQADPLRPPR